MSQGNPQAQGQPLPDQITLQDNRALEQKLAKEASRIKSDKDPNGTPIGQSMEEGAVLVCDAHVEQIRTFAKPGADLSSPAWPRPAGAPSRIEHLVQLAQSGQPAPGQDKSPEEPPPLPGYTRFYDETALQCIGGYWHEITYAFYAATAGNMPQIFVKIGDKDTGERCFVPPPGSRVPAGATTTKSLECINGYWYEVTYIIYYVGNPKNPFENPQSPPAVKERGGLDYQGPNTREIWVEFSATTTGRPCYVTTPKPNPIPPEPPGPGHTTTQPGGSATPGTTPAPPCPGGVLGSSRARSECNADGFWHVVSDEVWICPDGSRKEIKGRDIEKTKQPCKPGQPVPPGLPGYAASPQPPGPDTPQGTSSQTPGQGPAPPVPGTTSDPSAEALRQQIQSLERGGGSGGIYVPLQPPEQQTLTMPMPLQQPRGMPTTPGDMVPAPNWPTGPVPKGPATVTPAPALTGFPGRWRGDNGCGLGSLTIADEGGKLVAQGMPGNGPVPLAADGPMATAQGVVLFGQPNHQLLLSLSGSHMQIQARNPMGGSCSENFVRQ